MQIGNSIRFAVPLAAMLLTGACETPDPDIGSGKQEGTMSTFSGLVSTGEPIRGRSWFVRGRPHGEYCARVGQATRCEGFYPSLPGEPRVTVDFRCDDGRSGVIKVNRKWRPERKLMVPVSGFAVLSDGKTATIAFEDVAAYDGRTCEAID